MNGAVDTGATRNGAATVAGVSAQQDSRNTRGARADASILTADQQLAVEAGCLETWEWDLESNQIVRVPSACPADGSRLRLIRAPYRDFPAKIRQEDRAFVAEAIDQVIVQGTDYDIELRLAPPEGSVRWKASSGHALYDESRTPVRRIGIAVDVTDRERLVQALRDSEERYALGARGSNDGLWDWDLRSNALYLSDRWREMIGCAESRLSAGLAEWFDRVHVDDLALVHAHMNACLSGVVETITVEFRMVHDDCQYRWFLVRGAVLRNPEGQPYRLAGSLTDITMHKVAEERRRYDALHDALTGLPDRTLFLDRVAQALRRARRRKRTHVGVLVLDIDHLALVNNSLGHPAGDDLLRDVAKRLEGCIRASDTLARLDGGEFAILLDEVAEHTDTLTVSKRIRSLFATPFTIFGHDVFVTMSSGIASNLGGTATADNLLRNAQVALHHAKALGRDGPVMYERSMRSHLATLLDLGADLHYALSRREIEVYYQPIVRATDGVIVGLEALLRWNHPERGTLQPNQFISLAEEIGLIVPIGTWVLDQAIEDIRRWDTHGLPPVRLAVNVSARQIAQPDFVVKIPEALQRGGLSPARLELELTESLIMDRGAAATALLRSLRSIGVQIAIDDFGTGYSSLSYLQKLPVSSLKIDRSFVQSLGRQAAARKLVKMIVNIARTFGLRTIAEGVETERQRRMLRSLGNDEMQGFLFCRPLRMRELIDLVHGRQENRF